MPFELLLPRSLEEAWTLLEQGAPGSSMAMAGGTDLLLAMDFRRFAPERVVSLSRLPLDTVEFGEREVRIGSTVPLRTIELDPRVRRALPALSEALAEVGSVQLRHRATLGGNVVRASASSDLLPPLVAMDCRLTISSRKGRRSLSLDEFVESSWRTKLQPGELVEDLRIPTPLPGAYRWQRVRPANDISQVGVAVVRHPTHDGSSAPDWRIVAGGTSPRVQRLRGSESALLSPWPSEEEIAEAAQRAAQEARFATDLRAAEEYRRKLLEALVRSGIESTLERLREGGGR